MHLVILWSIWHRGYALITSWRVICLLQRDRSRSINLHGLRKWKPDPLSFFLNLTFLGPPEKKKFWAGVMLRTGDTGDGYRHVSPPCDWDHPSRWAGVDVDSLSGLQRWIDSWSVAHVISNWCFGLLLEHIVEVVRIAVVAQRRVKIIEWTNRQAFEKWQEPSLTNHLQRYALAAQSVSVILYQLPYVPVSQIESTVKASMLDFKILFSGSLCLFVYLLKTAQQPE